MPARVAPADSEAPIYWLASAIATAVQHKQARRRRDIYDGVVRDKWCCRSPISSGRRGGGGRRFVELGVEPAQGEAEADEQDAAAEDREWVGSEVFEPLRIEVDR